MIMDTIATSMERLTTISPLPVFMNQSLWSLNSSVNITERMERPQDMVTLISVVCYAIICWVGLIGNGLVVFVIARYANMKTITNLYILNLSIADWLFLLGLPLIITTSTLKHWVFGEVLCKLYFMLTCINMFTSAFTLVAMSVDRYLAVCHPVTSMPYRSRRFALFFIAVIWIVSGLVILPVLLYTQTITREGSEAQSCVMQWPASHAHAGKVLFIIYTLLLGFVLPVIIIVVLYSLLVLRLRGSRHAVLHRRSQRKVTRLVTTVIGVFVCSWLPYWAFQLFLITRPYSELEHSLEEWHVAMFQCFTILSYANSMVNPLLYAFTNDHFREAFKCAFRCRPENALVSQQRRRDSEYTSMRHHSHMNGGGGGGGGAVNGADPTNHVPLETRKIVKSNCKAMDPKLADEEVEKVSQGSPTALESVYFETPEPEPEEKDVVLLDTATQTDIPYSGVRAPKA